jgi:hypothetical protein
MLFTSSPSVFLGAFSPVASQSAKHGAKGSKAGSKTVAAAGEEAYLDEPADAKTTATDDGGVKPVAGAKVHVETMCRCAFVLS